MYYYILDYTSFKMNTLHLQPLVLVDMILFRKPLGLGMQLSWGSACLP